MAQSKKESQKTPAPANEPDRASAKGKEDSEPDIVTDPVSGRQEERTSAEDTKRDRTQSDIYEAQVAKAVEENPEHPEEAMPTQYLVGGEIPANAPGTEGMDREPLQNP